MCVFISSAVILLYFMGSNWLMTAEAFRGDLPTQQDYLYNPHKPSTLLPQWFEGWYTRASFGNGWSLGIIVGSYPLNRFHRDTDKLVSLILQRPGSNRLETVAINPRDLKITECSKSAQSPCFRIDIMDDVLEGSMNVDAEMQKYLLNFRNDSGSPLSKVELTISGPPEPWSADKSGPEGLFAILPLPIHWYVYSTASIAEARLRMGSNDKKDVIMKGLAHMEKNWGASFPSKWLWAQGVLFAGRNTSSDICQFAIAGGDLGIHKRLPHAYLLRWKGLRSNFTYGPLDNLLYPLNIEISDIQAVVRGRKSEYEFSIKITAPFESFSSVQCPTKNGFNAYSGESFRGKAEITIISYKKIIENVLISDVALEFGGEWWKQPELQFQE